MIKGDMMKATKLKDWEETRQRLEKERLKSLRIIEEIKETHNELRVEWGEIMIAFRKLRQDPGKENDELWEYRVMLHNKLNDSLYGLSEFYHRAVLLIDYTLCILNTVKQTL